MVLSHPLDHDLISLGDRGHTTPWYKNGLSARRGWHGSAAHNGGQGAELGPDQPRFRIRPTDPADTLLTYRLYGGKFRL